MTKWSEGIAARVAGEVKRLREEQQPRLSVAKLADRTTELGHPMSRAVISDLELGRKRTLDVAELLVLARALNVSPAALLYPELPDRPVEVWPDVSVRSILAVQWLSGESPPARLLEEGEQPVPTAEYEASQAGRERITIARQYEKNRGMAEQLAAESLDGFDEDQKRIARDAALRFRRETRKSLHRMRELGMWVDDE
ncbi:MAG: helix-turn-helix transcriptional regulator [Rhodococcus sp.]|nr:helix-turn-helix transcriptional regulator [Rhodococcus sp. (in: high G+C Gram-positive bacteria)]